MGAGAPSQRHGGAEEDEWSLSLDPMEPLMIATLACVNRGLYEAARSCAALDPVRDALRRCDPIVAYWNLSRPRGAALRRALARAVGSATAEVYSRERDALMLAVQSAARIASLFPECLDVLDPRRRGCAGGGPLGLEFLEVAGLLSGAASGFSFASAGTELTASEFDFCEAITPDQVAGARRLFSMLEGRDSFTAFAVAVDDAGDAVRRGDVIVLASPLGGVATTGLPMDEWLARFAQRLEIGGCAAHFRECRRDFPAVAALYAAEHAVDWELEGDAYL